MKLRGMCMASASCISLVGAESRDAQGNKRFRTFILCLLVVFFFFLLDVLYITTLCKIVSEYKCCCGPHSLIFGDSFKKKVELPRWDSCADIYTHIYSLCAVLCCWLRPPERASLSDNERARNEMRELVLSNCDVLLLSVLCVYYTYTYIYALTSCQMEDSPTKIYNKYISWLYNKLKFFFYVL